MAITKSFDGTKIYYVLKKGENKTLIFIHGWNLNHTTWNHQTHYFKSKGYSVLAMDLRGHGRSGCPFEEDKYRLENFAKDVKVLIDKNKLKNVVLVGHSLGGMIVLKYLEMFPETTKGIVLIDTTYESPLKSMGFRNVKYTNFTINLLKFILKHEALQKKHFKEVDFSAFKKHSDFYYWIKGYEQVSAFSLFSCLKEMLKFDEIKILDKINVPTLIFTGDKDFKTPVKTAKIMNKKIQMSKLVVLQNVSHDTPWTAPVRVNKEINNFLEILQ